MTEWRSPITKALVPLDTSEESKHVVSLLAHLFRAPRLRTGVEGVTLLYVIKAAKHPEYRVMKAKRLVETEAFKEVKRLFIKTQVEPILDEAEKALLREGYVKGRIARKLREGHIAEEITREVVEGSHDTVFLKGGKHEFREKLLATVTDTVVHALQGVNIYVGGIRPRSREAFSRFLVPIDGSKTSQKAVMHAAALARALGDEVKKITLLHVSIPGTDPEEVFQKARRVLEKQGIKSGIVQEAVREGDPADEIIAEARRHRVIVMGKRGLTKLQDIFLGSTSRKVLHSLEDRILILVS
jgi:nucleotide-binding universal stress UspA family protein